MLLNQKCYGSIIQQPYATNTTINNFEIQTEGLSPIYQDHVLTWKRKH